ncbi:hypothetical protein MMC25_002999 [Agyrium rufum]|nr:hypothetical protein [Agyrium rufum]
MAESSNTELESFRRKWQEEVTARTKGSTLRAETADISRPDTTGRGTNTGVRKVPPISSYNYEEPAEEDGEEEGSENKPSSIEYEKSAKPRAGAAGSFYDEEDREDHLRLGNHHMRSAVQIARSKEPKSALEHYETAVEQEGQGKLGDSLNHYRKAYRLDASVDKTYKTKHFSPAVTSSKPNNINTSNAAVTVPNTAHHSLDGPPAPVPNIQELIQSFAGLSIPSNEPPSPSSKLAALPTEILHEILLSLAIMDVSSFARLSLVCKHLAYLIATEDRIWRRVCCGPEVGLAAMHYTFACTLKGSPVPPPDNGYVLSDLASLYLNRIGDDDEISTSSLMPSLAFSPKYPNFKAMFRLRPRIRFNGLYISTVNYIRPGQASASTVTWNSPVHIVTYYRYLRFFRDGTCLSLLSTSEPADVISHLNKETADYARHLPTGSTLASAVARNALKGRWFLSRGETTEADSGPGQGEAATTRQLSSSLPGSSPLKSALISDQTTATSHSKISLQHASYAAAGTLEEGLLTVETLAPDPKYQYTMHLAIRSTSNDKKAGVVKNNKLVWKGFWSYNTLTDDWGEFGLRNDRAFYWSRVRSWA